MLYIPLIAIKRMFIGDCLINLDRLYFFTILIALDPTNQPTYLKKLFKEFI